MSASPLAPQGEAAQEASEKAIPACATTRWRQAVARDALLVLNGTLGPPSQLAPEPGGLAMWDRIVLTGSDLVRVELWDEAIDGKASVYCSVRYELLSNRPCHVEQLSDDMQYAARRKELTARSDTLEACVGMLAAATCHLSFGMHASVDVRKAIVDAGNRARSDTTARSQLIKQLTTNLRWQPGSAVLTNCTV